MTSEPSTSSGSLEADRSSLIQEALARAGVIRNQNQNVSPTNIKNPKKVALVDERIVKHPLMPVVELLLKKCEAACTTLDREVFEVDDIKNLFKSLEESGVQLSSNKDEVDQLMETTILALRTCLVEMERVFNLAENFKTKYMAILRRTVCHEALVGNSGDSDDELSDTPIMPGIRIGGPEFQAAQAKAMENAISALQSVGGPHMPMTIPPQAITMAQIERNLQFLKQCGFPTPTLPEDFFKQFAEKSPEKSEEEKMQRLPRSSPSSPD